MHKYDKNSGRREVTNLMSAADIAHFAIENRPKSIQKVIEADC